jgi:CRP/FNR family transcriptional regulator, anaerobic regulatory protein
VYLAGMPSGCISLVRSGSVSLTFAGPKGQGRIARLVTKGDLFGLEALLPESVYRLTAVVREPCRICTLTRLAFEHHVRSDSEAAWGLIVRLNHLVQDSEIEKLEISGERVQRRLTMLLTRLGLDPNERGRDTPVSGTAPEANRAGRIRQWEMAQLLGVSEETVSRALHQLRRRSRATLRTVQSRAGSACTR